MTESKKHKDERMSILEQAQIESRRRQKTAVENSMLVEEMSKISMESGRIRRAREEGILITYDYTVCRYIPKVHFGYHN